MISLSILILFFLTNTKQTYYFHTFILIHLTNLLSISRSSIRWFFIATWANSRIAWLNIMMEPTNQRNERSYYLPTLVCFRTNSRDNTICILEVWVHLRKMKNRILHNCHHISPISSPILSRHYARNSLS